MIDNNIRQRIINETSIVEVVSEYVKLEKKGNSHFGLCPFHDDKHPSMSVSDGVKMFNCWSCGTKGNVIYFVSKFEHISLDAAAIKLAKRIGIDIKPEVNKQEEKNNRLIEIMETATAFYQFYLNNSEEGLKALEYLHNRGISDDVIKTFKIGLAPNLYDGLAKHLAKKEYLELDQIEVGLVKMDERNNPYDTFRQRIMFPLTNPDGKTVGFSGRIYTESNQAKYINSNDNAIFHKGHILYNVDNAYNEAHRKNKIFIFEGFMDVIAAYRAGIGYGVATMGTALTQDHIKLLLSICNNIILCFDGDEAGINAMRKGAALFANFNIIPNAVVLPNNQDPDEYIKEFGSAALNKYLNDETKTVYEWLYLLAKKKLLVADLLSIESFKKEVFSFLSASKNSTVIGYYLNKMANDLNMELNLINRDFRNFNPNVDIQVKRIKDVKPKIEKKKTPVKVFTAYKIIIKNLITSPERRYDFENIYVNEALEYSIISKIKDLCTDSNLTNDIYNYKDRIVASLSRDEKFKAYLDSILNDNKIDANDKNTFNECVKTIYDYEKTLNNEKNKNRVKNELNQENISRFIEGKRN